MVNFSFPKTQQQSTFVGSGKMKLIPQHLLDLAICTVQQTAIVCSHSEDEFSRFCSQLDCTQHTEIMWSKAVVCWTLDQVPVFGRSSWENLRNEMRQLVLYTRDTIKMVTVGFISSKLSRSETMLQLWCRLYWSDTAVDFTKLFLT